MDFEKICSVLCYVLGAIFFVVALFGAWPHFFTMSVCFAAGILISEDEASYTE